MNSSKVFYGTYFSGSNDLKSLWNGTLVFLIKICTYVCVCMYMYVLRMYVYMYVCMYVCIYVRMYSMYIYIYNYICMYMYVCMYIRSSHLLETLGDL